MRVQVTSNLSSRWPTRQKTKPCQTIRLTYTHSLFRVDIFLACWGARPISAARELGPSTVTNWKLGQDARGCADLRHVRNMWWRRPLNTYNEQFVYATIREMSYMMLEYYAPKSLICGILVFCYSTTLPAPWTLHTSKRMSPNMASQRQGKVNRRECDGRVYRCECFL